MTKAFMKFVEAKTKESRLWAEVMFSSTSHQPEENLKKCAPALQAAMEESQKALNTWRLALQNKVS